MSSARRRWSLTADGVTTVFATNVLGHVVLLEGLLAEDRLGEVAVLVGSEAARGVPKLRMKGPSFVSTSADELATVIDGSYFAGGKPDFNLAFGAGQVHRGPLDGLPGPPTPRPPILTVSPGNTTGTQAPSGLALPLRVAAKYVMPALGLSHKLDVGAKRLVDGVTDPTLSSGVFYASAANKLNGPMVDQADILPRSGQPVVSGPRQRGHPPLHLMTAPRPGDAFHLDLDGTVIAGHYIEVDPPHRLLIGWDRREARQGERLHLH